MSVEKRRVGDTIVRLMESMGYVGFGSMAKFARDHYVDVVQMGQLIRGEEPPLGLYGNWFPIVEELALVFNSEPIDLFEESYLETLGVRYRRYKRFSDVVVGCTDILTSDLDEPFEGYYADELREYISDVLSGRRKVGMYTFLTDREKFVISNYFGIGCDALLVKDIAHLLCLSGTRVGHIRNRTLQKLRSPGFIENIKDFSPDFQRI